MIPTNIHSPLNRLALDAFLNTAQGRAQVSALGLLAVQLGRARYDLAHVRPSPKKAEGMGRATRRTRPCVHSHRAGYDLGLGLGAYAPAPVIIDDLVHRPIDPETMRRLAERSGKEVR